MSAPDPYQAQRDRLYQDYERVVTAITLLSVKDLAVSVVGAFPQAATLVLGDSDQGDHLSIEYAEDDDGQLIADAEELQDAGVEESSTAWNLSTSDLSHPAWSPYIHPIQTQSQHHRRGPGGYRMSIAAALSIPDSAFTQTTPEHPVSDPQPDTTS